MKQGAEKTRILLVEDDKDLSTVTAMRLRNKGYEVVCAFNGQEALEVILSENIDLVLLDVILPDMDGHEVCQRLRSEAIGYIRPVIFMSCMGDSDNIVDAFREGGNDYIVKPAKMEKLVERIQANLEGYKEKKGTETRLWFKQFMVDTKARSVYRVRDSVQQEKVELSRIEYDILMMLISKPEEIFLYRQLYRAVWGMEDMGDVRTLMVHVSNLRKKIDEEHADMIRAIRGVGYIFQDK